MDFVKYDLGHLSANEIVEVTLQNAANVSLMDSSNFQSYRNGRRHTYYGGHITQSPHRISVPYSGHWILAIDLGGYGGTIRSSVRIL